MPKIVSIHSFRGGTGKSHIAANLAAILAEQGLRVGVIDANNPPGIRYLFNLEETDNKLSFDDYLDGKCGASDILSDITPILGANIPGRAFVLSNGNIYPSANLDVNGMSDSATGAADVERLSTGCHRLCQELQLNMLIVDNQAGLAEETLLYFSITDLLLVLMRPDQLDYQGTGTTVEIAKRLNISKTALIVNKTPDIFDFQQVKEQATSAYNVEVAAVIPHSSEIAALAGSSLFITHYPNDPITDQLREIADFVIQ